MSHIILEKDSESEICTNEEKYRLTRYNRKYSKLLHEHISLITDIIQIILDYTKDHFHISCNCTYRLTKYMVYCTQNIKYFELIFPTIDFGAVSLKFSNICKNVITYSNNSLITPELPGGLTMERYNKLAKVYFSVEEKNIMKYAIFSNNTNEYILLFFNYYMQKYYGKGENYLLKLHYYPEMPYETNISYDKINRVYIIRVYNFLRERCCNFSYLVVKVVNHKKLKEMIVCMKLLIDKYITLR